MDRAGLTQVGLAKKLGVSEGAVSKWLRTGQGASIRSLARMPVALGVTLDWLVGVPAAPEPPALPSVADVRALRQAIRRLNESVAAVAEGIAAILPSDDEA